MLRTDGPLVGTGTEAWVPVAAMAGTTTATEAWVAAAAMAAARLMAMAPAGATIIAMAIPQNTRPRPNRALFDTSRQPNYIPN